MKRRWDLFCGGLVILLPEVPGLIDQLQLIDLSALDLSDGWKAFTKLVGAFLPVLRTFILYRIQGK